MRGGINIFAGLLRNAADGGGTFHTGRRCPEEPRFLYPYKATHEGKGTGHTFPLAAFEEGILSALREVDPREVIPTNGHVADTLALAGELAEVEGKIAKATAQLVANPDVDALVGVLRSLEGQKRRISEELTKARQNSATPLGEAWGDCRSLMAVACSSDENRVRLRAVLRRVIDSIWVLIVPVGIDRDRVCAAQVHFAGGEHRRSYLIFHRAATRARKARSWTRSFADAATPGELDLRRRDHARKLEKALLALDLSQMT
jgi:hypothetical protein